MQITYKSYCTSVKSEIVYRIDHLQEINHQPKPTV